MRSAIVILILVMCLDLRAETGLGKIIQITGDVDITSLSTRRRLTPKVGIEINKNYKIRTGKRAFIEILLNNGTKVFIKEVSVLNINAVKMTENEAPTRIKMLTGKVRIRVKKSFRSRTLILTTPTSIVGVSGTDFGVITSKHETKVIVFEGAIHIASSNRNIIKAIKLSPREESRILYNKPPEEPFVVPPEILRSWLDYYEVVDNKKIVIKGEEEKGLIDRILRKREF